MRKMNYILWMLICAVTDRAWQIVKAVNQWTATQAKAAGMELTGTHNDKRSDAPAFAPATGSTSGGK
jgi:hypothetical protein